MKRYQKNLIASLLFTLSGCASSGNAATAVAPQSEDQPAEAATVAVAAENANGSSSFTDDQADGGREVFRSQCTECHAS
ncbi:MAG: hypothetical protein CMH51_02070, partial [Myxococcales bacterium]|nr:hypothetical protein [Myxococcales bacterium]